jgi:cation transport ATPase
MRSICRGYGLSGLPQGYTLATLAEMRGLLEAFLRMVIAVAVGTGVAAKHNILIKEAATLEGLAGITAIVLDKTGTLTEGKPALSDLIVADGYDKREVLRMVASAQRGSEHLLAEAIVAGAQTQGLALADVTVFESIAGHGIRARLDGRVVLVGNRKLMQGGTLPVCSNEFIRRNGPCSNIQAKYHRMRANCD